MVNNNEQQLQKLRQQYLKAKKEGDKTMMALIERMASWFKPQSSSPDGLYNLAKTIFTDGQNE